jgi:hypothetical protein
MSLAHGSSQPHSSRGASHGQYRGCSFRCSRWRWIRSTGVMFGATWSRRPIVINELAYPQEVHISLPLPEPAVQPDLRTGTADTPHWTTLVLVPTRLEINQHPGLLQVA